MNTDKDKIEIGTSGKTLAARNMELSEKTRVATPGKSGRQYIVPRKKTVDHTAIRKMAETEPYRIESELARGAESGAVPSEVDSRPCSLPTKVRTENAIPSLRTPVFHSM